MSTATAFLTAGFSCARTGPPPRLQHTSPMPKKDRARLARWLGFSPVRFCRSSTAQNFLHMTLPSFSYSAPGLAQGSLEGLIRISVRERLQRLRPLSPHHAAQLLGARLPIPPHLLHVVIELYTVPVRIQHMRRIINAWVQFRRDALHQLCSSLLAEVHSAAQLLVASDLDAKRHTGGV